MIGLKCRVAMLALVSAAIISCSTGWAAQSANGRTRPNLLLNTVDDMNCDSVGAFGCKLPGTTPNIDRLASQGLRFAHAHVQVGNCMPSRNVLLSGLYPHTNGVRGFFQVRNIGYPVLADLMKRGGYYVAIRGKVDHSTPYQPYAWDEDLTILDSQPAHPKDPHSYYESTCRGIAAAKQAGKPFCLVINIADPHKPFYSGPGDKHPTSKVFKPAEVPVPGFLFDHPQVRRELARYYSSVRRADDCVGEVLKALDESGQADRTVVMFLSDHGMPFPFAKTQLYHHSTHTPWIVRWPGITKPGAVDERHMISAIDALPTLLDIAGIEHPAGLQGRSFLPLVKGEPQEGRELVFKEYHENFGGSQNPMWGVQSREFLYLFNPWSDGRRKMRTATTGTAAYRTMVELAKTDPAMAARLKRFDHRAPEEFYDVANDPDARHNLIDDPKYKTQVDQMRNELEAWMERTNDPALAVFRGRDDRQLVEKYMAALDAEAAARRAKRREARGNPQTK